MMQHLRSHSYTLVSVDYSFWLKWFTLPRMRRCLLLRGLLVMLVGLMLLLSLSHPVMLPASVSQLRLVVVGCGENC